MSKSTNNEIEQLRDTFLHFLASESDSIPILFQSHSFFESMLDRFIELLLPKGEKVIQNAHISFRQKLVLVDALDILGKRYVQYLHVVDTIKNKYLEHSEKKLSLDDIILLSQGIDTTFQESEQSDIYDNRLIFRGILGDVCVHLSSKILFLEHRGSSSRYENDS